MSARLRLILLLLACAWSRTVFAQSPPALAVVLGERANPHLEMVDILRKALGPGSATGAEVTVLGWHELAQLPKGSKLIVAVGARAAETLAAIDPPAPVLATLLPRKSFMRAMESRQDSRRFSAVYLDQPPGRQLDLLRLALPERRRIALLTGPDSRALGAPFSAAAAERDLRLNIEYVSGESALYSALQRSLGDADLLLAIPDPALYNANSISDILLTAYRYRVPVIGFSPAYVKAGALMALYSSTAQVGAQVVDIAREVLAGRSLPPPQYPRDYSVGINTYVARSLNLTLRQEDESSLLTRMHQEEHHP